MEPKYNNWYSNSLALDGQQIATTGASFRPITDTYYIPFFDTDVDENDDWFENANNITPSTKQCWFMQIDEFLLFQTK